MNTNTILSVQKDVTQGVIRDIDDNNYFNLKVGVTSRESLFNLAIALGVKVGKTPLSSQNDLLRGDYVTKSEYLYHSLMLKDGNENSITEEKRVADFAEQYANSGFAILKDYMQRYTDEQLAKKLLAEMDSLYVDIEPELKKIK